ncbi:hypothetical protein [Kordiimonas aestuarii]|uniref:hypothetical protein n=1 Tax=Kordiimonas aestuarii TaxID=1005925 RepID=UPI0021CE93B6|nr:hypothetical protein [Kordiimonas aestuarii]
MKTLTTVRTIAAGASLAMIAGTGALADPAYHNDRHGGAGYARSAEFRYDNPIKVYVNVDTKGRGRTEDRFERLTEQAMRHNLPDYVRLVDSARMADMVINAREQDYDLDFRVVDRDREQERYKQVNQRSGDRCGPYYKASYTVVKEKAEARASYAIRIQTDGVGRDRERIIAGANSYLTYGDNLKAHTRCSADPTNRFPNHQVKDMFNNKSPAYRARVAQGVRQETAADLGRKLAYEIKSNVDDYYAGLAVRYAHGGHYGNPWKGRDTHKTSHGRWD